MEKKQLNDREKAFIELLFHEDIGGNATKAKVAAGYSSDYATSTLVKRLEEEIIEATKQFFSQNAPKAAMKLVGVMDDPAQIGTKEILASAKDLLDRAGLAKTEKMEIKAAGGIFILPPKEMEVDEDGE